MLEVETSSEKLEFGMPSEELRPSRSRSFEPRRPGKSVGRRPARAAEQAATDRGRGGRGHVVRLRDVLAHSLAADEGRHAGRRD